MIIFIYCRRICYPQTGSFQKPVIQYNVNTTTLFMWNVRCISYGFTLRSKWKNKTACGEPMSVFPPYTWPCYSSPVASYHLRSRNGRGRILRHLMRRGRWEGKTRTLSSYPSPLCASPNRASLVNINRRLRDDWEWVSLTMSLNLIRQPPSCLSRVLKSTAFLSFARSVWRTPGRLCMNRERSLFRMCCSLLDWDTLLNPGLMAVW